MSNIFDELSIYVPVPGTIAEVCKTAILNINSRLAKLENLDTDSDVREKADWKYEEWRDEEGILAAYIRVDKEKTKQIAELKAQVSHKEELIQELLQCRRESGRLEAMRKQIIDAHGSPF